MYRLRSALCAALIALFPGFCLAETITVAVISDMNGQYGSTDYAPSVDDAVARIIELSPDVVLSTGDMVAGQRRRPKLTMGELDAMWQSFRATVSEPLRNAGLPLAATPGNHDGSVYLGFELERRRYAQEWASLAAGLEMVDPGTFPFAYAFRISDVLFISLDATAVGALPPEQMDWLRRLLDRTAGQYRATIAFSHLPLWPFAIDRETEVIGDPELAALFRDRGVDLHLSGHHHAYYPGTFEGVVYVSQSCLGGGPRRLIGTEERAPRSFTVIAISDDGTIGVQAYKAPGFLEQIDITKLPERIVSNFGTITRTDLSSTTR